MLRRTRALLRVLLFVAGAGLLLWLPLSFFLYARVWAPLGVMDVGVSSHSGQLTVAWDVPPYWSKWASSVQAHGYPARWKPALWPKYTSFERNFYGTDRHTSYTLHLPLWLLIFLCLAWPLTSFLVARRTLRGRGRGFDVEPSAKPLPPQELPRPTAGVERI